MGNHTWDKYVNMSIFGVSVVDTYNFATQSISYEDTSRVLLCDLSEDMTDNDINLSPTTPSSNRTVRSASHVPVKKRVA